MSFWINNKRIIPAPLVTQSKQIVFAGDGKPIGTTHSMNLKGTLLPGRGSPYSTGWWISEAEFNGVESILDDNDGHNNLLIKQELLRHVLSQSESVKLAYAPSGDSQVVFYGKLRGINFDPGVWVQRSDYSIDLVGEVVDHLGVTGYENAFAYSTSGYYLTAANDNWQIGQQDGAIPQYNISRTVSATAVAAYGSAGLIAEGWVNAKNWVLTRVSGVGIEQSVFPVTGIHPTTGFYNTLQQESIDKTAGSYSLQLTQTYMPGGNNYAENRTVSRQFQFRLLDDNSPTQIESITVNGTIAGLGTGSVSGRLANAYTYWNTLYPSVLPTQVGAYGSGITVNLNENWNNGSLEYTVNFVNSTGSTYVHVYDVSYNSDGTSPPSVSINGTINGVTLDGYYGPSNRKMNNAISGWLLIEPNLKTLAFTYPNGTLLPTGVTSARFADKPFGKAVGYNKANGAITYSANFPYKDPSGSSDSTYQETFNIDFNTANVVGDSAGGLLSNATIQGTIQGVSTSDFPLEKYANAEAAWATVRGVLYNRVSGLMINIFADCPIVTNRPSSKAVSLNRLGGTISYSVAFTNELPASGTSVAVADVTVENTPRARVVAQQPIPGRAVGPIIQDIATTNAYARNVNITLGMQPKGSRAHWTYSDITTPRAAASGYLASVVGDLGVLNTNYFIVAEPETWNWKNGSFTKNYQLIVRSGL
jgi:hypothetical protein